MGVLSSLFLDLRFAVRSFWQRPGFTAVVVATLALAIGANTAIFSVANAVLFQPLPFEEPERLALIWNRMANANRPNAPVSGPDFLDFKTETRLFEDFAGAIAVEATLTGEERPEQIMIGWSTYNLFDILGTKPFMGRTFEPSDGTAIDPKVFLDPSSVLPPGAVMLSHGMWQRTFGGDRQVLGKTRRRGATSSSGSRSGCARCPGWSRWEA